MKLLHACPPSCKRLRIDAATAGAADRRPRALELIDRMVEGGMRRGEALRTVGLASSTYYDWRKAFRRGGVRALKPRSTRPRTVRRRRWTDADDRAVLKLRGEHPYMGKAKLRTMLAGDGLALSVSTVGRILSRAIADLPLKPASSPAPPPATPSASWRRWSRPCPSPSPPSKWTAAASSWPTSSAPAGPCASHCTSCRPEGHSGTAASSAPTGPPGSSSGTSTTAPSPSPT